MTTTDTTERATSDTAVARRPSAVLRAVSAIERVGIAGAGAALLAMTVLMVIETGMRYIAGSPLGWSFGFIQDYLLPGYFFLALAYTFRVGAHVSIDVVYQRCPAKVQAAMTVVGRVLMLAMSALLLWAGILATHDVWQSRDIPPPGGAELSIPTWTWHILVPVGAALLTLRLVCDVVTRRRPVTDDGAEEES
jgi:TRAP-type C4-dicarboxylate transport system permease small subunit